MLLHTLADSLLAVVISQLFEALPPAIALITNLYYLIKTPEQEPNQLQSIMALEKTYQSRPVNFSSATTWHRAKS